MKHLIPNSDKVTWYQRQTS